MLPLSSKLTLPSCPACLQLIDPGPYLRLTPTGAQLFSWCAANLELTRLDVSHNPELAFQGISLTNPLQVLRYEGASRMI